VSGFPVSPPSRAEQRIAYRIDEDRGRVTNGHKYTISMLKKQGQSVVVESADMVHWGPPDLRQVAYVGGFFVAYNVKMGPPKPSKIGKYVLHATLCFIYSPPATHLLVQ
jgi:hypothetical protein